jgi:FkbM family methyltransferase
LKIFKPIFKLVLDFIAWVLRQSKDGIYYLIKGPLRKEVQEASLTAFAYQHIDNACTISKQFGANADGIVLDVGGGTATTAVIFQSYFPQSSIYIFEPLKNNFATISEASKGHSNWNLVNKAVGAEIGTTTINVANRVTASSLLELNPETESHYADMLTLKGKETIQITTLDTEIPHDKTINVLKIDVQGFELEVLKGGSETLYRTKVIVLEVNNHTGYKGAPSYFEIDSFIRDKGFELYDILPSARVKNKLQDWDAIYVNKTAHNS